MMYYKFGGNIFSPVENREILSKKIAEQIEEAIHTKKLITGNKLPSEAELSAQFGVSRTALREALRIVSAKGLLKIEKGKGIFVSGISAKIVSDPLHQYLKYKIEKNYALDLIHARQIIEPSIAAYAALHRTEEDIDKLHQNIEELKRFDGPFEGLARMDMDFHLQIAQASNNQVMPLILDPIHRLMPEIKKSIYKTNQDAKESAIEWHTKIFDQIVAGDPEKSREAMIMHLKIAEEHIQTMLAAQTAGIILD